MKQIFFDSVKRPQAIVHVSDPIAAKSADGGHRPQGDGRPARVELDREAEWDPLPGGGGSEPPDEADQEGRRAD